MTSAPLAWAAAVKSASSRAPAVGGRILDDGAELAAREFVFVVVVDDEFDAERFAGVSSTSSVCGKRLRSTKS